MFDATSTRRPARRLAMLLLAGACAAGCVGDDGDESGSNVASGAGPAGAAPTTATSTTTSVPPPTPGTTSGTTSGTTLGTWPGDLSDATSSTPTTTTTAPAGAASTGTDAGASTSTTHRTAPPRRRDFSAVSPIVERFIAEQGLEGAGLVVVDREDGVVYEDYWGSFSADRISLVASSSKMVTAGVLMRLDEDGLLDLDAPVAEVVDWGSANPDITPAQLISNSAGLVGLLPFPGYAPYRCQWDAAADLQTCGATIFTTRDDDGEVAPPDTEFRYGGAQWQVAGAVAEAASGRSWAELIEEVYVEPCGLASLGYNNHWSQLGTVGFDYPDAFAGDPATLRPTANPNMEGGMYTTPGDYAELLLMHLRGGRCSGGQVLSPEAVDRLHRDRVGAVYGGLAGAGSGYGMGWWVDVVTGRLTDSGAYGSTPWLDVQDGYGAYLVLEADAIMGYELSRQLFDVVEAAVTGS